MGLFTDVLGAVSDDSNSSSYTEGAPSGLIPFPDLSRVPVKQRKKLVQQWMDRNTAVALSNNMDKILNALAYAGLFAGQIGLYYTLDMYHTGKLVHDVYVNGVYSHTISDEQMKEIRAAGPPPPNTSYQAKVVDVPKWTEITATAAIITALSYMMRHNTAAAVYPVGGILGVLATDKVGGLLGDIL